MKATVINDTTFRLFSITLENFEKFCLGEPHLQNLWCGDNWSKEVNDWLDEHAPGSGIEYHCVEISESTYHYETFLKFKTPADAVAFKLRWL